MERSLVIDSTLIADAGDCYIIAEIGHNHQGSVEKAKELFKAAKECGVDAVKLQKRDNRALYTLAMYNQPYDNENSFGPTYGAHREALEFGREAYLELKRYAQELGVTFFATAFDFPSADFLAELDLPAIKIASGDLKNTPLLKRVAKIGKPVIISTGGGTMDDVRRAHDTLAAINPAIGLLQCTAHYPCEAENTHLRVITTFRDAFPNTVIGLSDHQNGIALAEVAYTLGARIIEKHFTLNRAWKGTDHAFSLEPVGMRKLVRDMRRARLAMGDGVKRPLPGEERPMLKMGKKLCAARDLPSGHVLTAADIAIKSPGDGLPPCHFDEFVGRTLVVALKEDESLTRESIRGG